MTIEYGTKTKIKKEMRIKIMKKLNVLLAAVLSFALLFGAVVPAQAASAEVQFEIKATDPNVAVNVPTTLPIVFNEDGTNTYPTNWTIENTSAIARIYLYSVSLTAANDWILMTGGMDPKNNNADTKKVKFYVGPENNLEYMSGRDNGTTGYVQFEPEDFTIVSGGSKDLCFKVERGAFTQNASMQKAFDMVLTFKFL